MSLASRRRVWQLAGVKSWSWWVVSCGLITACGAPPGAREPSAPARPPRPVTTAPTALAALQSVELLSAPPGTYGPYVARRSSGGLVAWAHGEPRRWSARGLGRDAAPLELGPAPTELGVAALIPVGGDGQGAGGQRGSAGARQPRPGEAHYVLVAAGVTADGEGLDALALGPEGELLATSAVTSGVSQIRWVDAVTTRSGVVVLWAADRGARVELLSALLDAHGALLHEARVVAEDVSAWQVQRTVDGALLALATAAPEGGRRIVTRALDAAGTPVGAPQVVGSGTSAEPSLDLAPLGEGFALVWVDSRDEDERLYAARLDGHGALLAPPRALTAGPGDEALVYLGSAGGAGPLIVAWEDLARRPAEGRAIDVAELLPSGELGAARARLLAEGEVLPELAATDQGVAGLLLAPACPASAARCEPSLPVPSFIELDRQLAPVAAEPLRLAALDGQVVDVAWGLSCAPKGCHALAAAAGAPAPVFEVGLKSASTHWRAPLLASAEAQRPRLRGSRALATTPPLAALDVAALAERRLVGWLSYFDPSTKLERLARPAPDGRFDPPQALIQLRAVAADGALGPTHTISFRARSAGGLALSPAAPGVDKALALWTALDFGKAQLFATLVDGEGKKLQQRMVTQGTGAPTDVAAVRVQGGWLVAWVDERHGDPEVYVMKLGEALQRLGPELRVTDAPGAASEPALLVSGREVLLVWADTRDAEQPGRADLWAARLAPEGPKLLQPPARLIKTPLHAHTPQLALQGDRPVLAYIEESPEQPAASRVRLLRLDEVGQAMEDAGSLPALGGVPTSLTLDCDARACRGFTVIAAEAGPELYAFPGVTEAPTPWLRLAGPPAQPVPARLRGGELFMGEPRAEASARPRWLRLAW